MLSAQQECVQEPRQVPAWEWEMELLPVLAPVRVLAQEPEPRQAQEPLRVRLPHRATIPVHR